MRVAVISDTHLPRGARTLPAACRERLAAADLVLHAGDITSVAFLGELRAIGPPVEAVHGNMDEPALRAMLPAERIVAVGEARFGMLHIGGPREGREARLITRFPGCEAVIYGHTHVPQADLVDGVWILNPGSPTERRTAPRRSMLELAVAGRTIMPHLVTFGP